MTEPYVDVEFTAEEAEVLHGLHASMADNIRAQVVARIRQVERPERGLMRQPGLSLQAKGRYRERADALLNLAGVVERMALSLD